MARPTFTNHPKTKRALHILQIPEAHFRGLMEMLWDTANESGKDEIGDSLDVELSAKWTGKPGVFTAAICEVGLIERPENGADLYRIHDFWDHCPEYVKKRYDRELARKESGKTISDIRRAAVNVRWNTNGIQTDTNEKHLNTNGIQTDTNGCRTDTNDCPPTPTPTPTPTLKEFPATQVKKPKKEKKTHPAFAPSKKLWIKVWSERNDGREYYWTARDSVALNTIIGFSKGDTDAIEYIFDVYLRDDDPFVIKKAFALTWLASNVNAYGAVVLPPAKELSREELGELMAWDKALSESNGEHPVKPSESK